MNNVLYYNSALCFLYFNADILRAWNSSSSPILWAQLAEYCQKETVHRGWRNMYWKVRENYYSNIVKEFENVEPTRRSFQNHKIYIQPLQVYHQVLWHKSLNPYHILFQLKHLVKQGNFKATWRQPIQATNCSVCMEEGTRLPPWCLKKGKLRQLKRHSSSCNLLTIPKEKLLHYLETEMWMNFVVWGYMEVVADK